MRRVAMLVVGATVLVSAVGALGWVGLQRRFVRQASGANTTSALRIPDAEAPAPFTRVAGVRELRDGRVMVLDKLDRALSIVDFGARRATPVGRIGRGPDEFLLPRALLPWRGDSSLLIDEANFGSVLIVTPDGVLSGLLRTGDSTSRRGDRFKDFTDSLGHLFSQLPLYRRTEEGIRPGADTALVVRLDAGSQRLDTIARVSIERRIPGVAHSVTARPTAAQPFLRRTEPFAVSDQWVTMIDGRVAIVGVEPYRVTYVDSAGRRVVGNPVPTQPVEVNEALKAAWREERTRPVPVLMFTSAGVGAQMVPMAFDEPARWPTELPPFADRSVHGAPDGTLWVQRWVAPGEPSIVDVFDGAGLLKQRVTLPPDTRIVGFGRAAVFVVRVDADDLEYLQRFALPSMRRR